MTTPNPRDARQAAGPGGEARRFEPRPPKPTLRPRRVAAGVKLRSREGPDMSSWAAQRWMRLAENCAPGDQLAEGIQYAKLGQTRTLDVQPGVVTARVQGRMPEAYATTIRLPKFQPEHWEQVLAAMTTQARYAATLLAGDLPANIEDVFVPLGLKLFPSEPSEVAVSCNCRQVARAAAAATPASPGGEGEAGAAAGGAPPADVGGGGGWCKHVCCVMTLLADRFSADPFLIFTLRGMPGAELLERLSQRRAVAGAVGASSGASPIYLPHLPGISDMAPEALESALDRFWTVGPTLDLVDLPIEAPEVPHPLLRRLGPSPFDAATGAKFPLVGLMATCYDVISAAAIEGQGHGAEGETEGDDGSAGEPV